MIGRPWLYGLAAAGEAGVTQALKLLSQEIDRVQALLGVTEMSQLSPDLLNTPSPSQPDLA